MIQEHNNSIDDWLGPIIPGEVFRMNTALIEWSDDNTIMESATIINPENEQRLIYDVWIPTDMRADNYIEQAFAIWDDYTSYSSGSIARLLEDNALLEQEIEGCTDAMYEAETHEVEDIHHEIARLQKKIEDNNNMIHKLYFEITYKYGVPYGDYPLPTN